MELPGYILRIAPFVINPPKIDDATIMILLLFTLDSPLSTYKIHKILDNAGYKITPPGILKKIKKLAKMKLIERSELKSQKVSKNDSRGAIYYKLTEEGIFLIHNNHQLLSKYNQFYIKTNLKEKIFPETQLFYEKGIYRTHSNCSLFTIFLNPWISIETVKRLGPRLIMIIRRFLADCCLLLSERILTLNESMPLVHLQKQEKLPQSEYMNFEAIKKGVVKSKTFPLTHILKESFNLDVEAFKLDRVDRNTVNISDLSDNVLYQLLYKEAEIELEISSLLREADRITLKAISIEEIITPHIEYFHDLITSDCDLLVDDIVFKISMDGINTRDLHFLKSDSSFIQKLSELKSRFLEKYDLFIE